jgi:hypothetical protein
MRGCLMTSETAPFTLNSGNVLLSRTVTRAVPSALEGLTTEFGMGSGVTPPLWSPEVFHNGKRHLTRDQDPSPYWSTVGVGITNTNWLSRTTY